MRITKSLKGIVLMSCPLQLCFQNIPTSPLFYPWIYRNEKKTNSDTKKEGRKKEIKNKRNTKIYEKGN